MRPRITSARFFFPTEHGSIRQASARMAMPVGSAAVRELVEVIATALLAPPVNGRTASGLNWHWAPGGSPSQDRRALAVRPLPNRLTWTLDVCPADCAMIVGATEIVKMSSSVTCSTKGALLAA